MTRLFFSMWDLWSFSQDLVSWCSSSVSVITFDSKIIIEWFKKIRKANSMVDHFVFHRPSLILTFWLSKMGHKILSKTPFSRVENFYTFLVRKRGGSGKTFLFNVGFASFLQDLVWLRSSSVLTLTSNSNIGIEWLKKISKANSMMNNFIYYGPSWIPTFW